MVSQAEQKSANSWPNTSDPWVCGLLFCGLTISWIRLGWGQTYLKSMGDRIYIALDSPNPELGWMEQMSY
jgi:hypothetical protein